ncbi:hypothetical protein B484DRAFT_161415 [Ochromonadaceae sp. CCMP2298]|nr:hypothetical protein B484DRAFT_161415 [Ochromonadaceae sp. CCMP2298]
MCIKPPPSILQCVLNPLLHRPIRWFSRLRTAPAPRRTPKEVTVPRLDLVDLYKLPDKTKLQAEFTGQSHISVPPGTFVGMDLYFIRSPKIPIKTHLAQGAMLVGYVTYDTLDALGVVYARYLRVLNRNYHMLLLNWVKLSVPLLCDMEEGAYASLASRVQLRGFEKDSTVRANPATTRT